MKKGTSDGEGARPRFGEPSVATLTIGGDDIDFPGILFNCIIESHIPGGGPPFRTCDDQRTHSWSLINDPSLVTNISELIGKIVTKAQQGGAGDNFKLYVTGYGQFFNNETTLCNTVTFARTANPKPDNKPHTNMTTALRTEFNAMSLGLNAAIQKAVAQNAQNGVKYIDIDAPLTGHRFCEAGIQEPDQNNPNLWLWHYPYNQPDGAEIGSTGPDYTSVLQAANAKVFGSQSISQLSQQYGSARAVDDAFYNAIDWTQISGGVNATGFWDGVVGSRAKLFHPQEPWHTWIQNTIVNQWKQDRDVDSTGVTSTLAVLPAPTAAPTPTAPPSRWSYTFHSYTGNIQSGNFSFFVLPGKYNGSFTNSKRSLEGRGDAVGELPSNPHYRSLAGGRWASTEDSMNKRVCCGTPPPPPPPPNTPGQVCPSLLFSPHRHHFLPIIHSNPADSSPYRSLSGPSLVAELPLTAPSISTAPSTSPIGRGLTPAIQAFPNTLRSSLVMLAPLIPLTIISITCMLSMEHSIWMFRQD